MATVAILMKKSGITANVRACIMKRTSPERDGQAEADARERQEEPRDTVHGQQSRHTQQAQIEGHGRTEEQRKTGDMQRLHCRIAPRRGTQPRCKHVALDSGREAHPAIEHQRSSIFFLSTVMFSARISEPTLRC